MKKTFSSILRGKGSKQAAAPNNSSQQLNSPEAGAARGVKLFCESVAPKNTGDEVLHLPGIVESAESSPGAAAAAALQIRKFLSKDYYSKAHIQYNAIMLIRILADNPGQSFTKNIDGKFVDAVRSILRQSRDPSVQQITRETLNSLEHEKAYDTNLVQLIAMWRKERGFGTPRPQQQPNAPPSGPMQQQPPPQRGSLPDGMASLGPQPYSMHPRGSRRQQMPQGLPQGYDGQHGRLPPPAELASRVEEARTSAKLLIQLTQTTPPRELDNNDLIKEFANRCTSAQRNLQGFMDCRDPAPDENTFQTLIETCEQLYLAQSKHQRALLAARRMTSPPDLGYQQQQRQPPMQRPMQGQIPNQIPNQMMPNQMQGQMPNQMQGQVPNQMQGQMPNQMQGPMQGPILNQMQGPLQGQMASQVSSQSSTQTPTRMASPMPGQMPGVMSPLVQNQVQDQNQRQMPQQQIPRQPLPQQSQLQAQRQIPPGTMRQHGPPPPPPAMQAQLQRRVSRNDPSLEQPSILRSNTDSLHALPAQDPFAEDLSDEEEEDPRAGFSARPEAYLRARSANPGMVELADSNAEYNGYTKAEDVADHSRDLSTGSTKFAEGNPNIAMDKPLPQAPKAAPAQQIDQYAGEDDNDDMYDQPPASHSSQQAGVQPQEAQPQLLATTQSFDQQRDVSPMRDSRVHDSAADHTEVSSNASPIANTLTKPVPAPPPQQSEDTWSAPRQAWANRAAAAQSQAQQSSLHSAGGLPPTQTETQTTSPISAYSPHGPQKTATAGTLNNSMRLQSVKSVATQPSIKTSSQPAAYMQNNSNTSGSYEGAGYDTRNSFEQGDDQTFDANTGSSLGVAAPRIKDDDPLTPLTPGTAEQWKY